MVGRSRKSGRRRAVKDQKGRWIAIPRPRVLGAEEIPVRAPISSRIAKAEKDLQSRWLVLVHVVVRRSLQWRALASLAHLQSSKVALLRRAAELSRAHERAVAEKEAERHRCMSLIAKFNADRAQRRN